MNSTKEDHIEVEGRITAVLAGTMFRVELDNKHSVLATICGKMRKRFVRLTAGDRVGTATAAGRTAGPSWMTTIALHAGQRALVPIADAGALSFLPQAHVT